MRSCCGCKQCRYMWTIVCFCQTAGHCTNKPVCLAPIAPGSRNHPVAIHMQSCNGLPCTKHSVTVKPGRLMYTDCPLVCGSSEIDHLQMFLLHSPLPFQTFFSELLVCSMPAYAAAHRMICVLLCSNLLTAATTPGDVQSTVQFSPAAGLGSGGSASPAAAAAGELHLIRLCADTLPELCSDIGKPPAGNYHTRLHA